MSGAHQAWQGELPTVDLLAPERGSGDAGIGVVKFDVRTDADYRQGVF